MKQFILQPYKDWLISNRGEIRPEVGDKYIKFDISSESTIEKDDSGNTHTTQSNDVLKQEYIITDNYSLNLHNRFIKRDKDAYFKDKYVEIPYNPNEAIEFGQFIKDNLWKYGIKDISIKELYKQFKENDNIQQK